MDIVSGSAYYFQHFSIPLRQASFQRSNKYKRALWSGAISKHSNWKWRQKFDARLRENLLVNIACGGIPFDSMATEFEVDWYIQSLSNIDIVAISHARSRYEREFCSRVTPLVRYEGHITAVRPEQSKVKPPPMKAV